MNNLDHRPTAALPIDFQELNGRIVLVKSKRDHRNPPTAMRGWIEVPAHAETVAEVSIVVEFPQMFATRARHRTFRLDELACAQLLASEHSGIFEFTIDDELN